MLLAAIGSTRVTELKSSDAGGHTLHTSRQRVGGQRTWALHVGWRLSIVRGSCVHARSLIKTHYRLNAAYFSPVFGLLIYAICGSTVRDNIVRVESE